MIYDAHLHKKGNEDGGFLIGLEGKPKFESTLTNQEALSLHDPKHSYFAFHYVSANEIKKSITHPLLKYHPRREHYDPESVSYSISLNQPRAIIIDTLNEPFWIAYDYWKIAKENKDIPMIMAHSGGYLINEFIKMCHFQSNIWIDFALTHTTLAKLGDKEIGLNYINDAIKYSLCGSFKNRVLLASDYPFFNQDDVFRYYAENIELLNRNYLKFVEEYLL